MKISILAKKIHKLEENWQSDFHLIGISSYENDYRVCWDVNNCLKTNLQKTENFELVDKDSETSQTFPVFLYEDETRYLVFKLIGNRSETGLLTREWKNMDFFLKITGEITKKELYEILERIKKSTLIRTAMILEPRQAKTIHILNSIH